MDPARRFPGIGQAVLLILLSVALMMGLAIPVAIAGSVLNLRLVEHPGMLGCINLLSFGAVLGIGAYFAKAPLGELFPIRRFKPALVLPMFLSLAGTVILLSEADNWVRHFLPPPQWLASYFADLTGGTTSLWGSLFALAVVAPLTEELFFRGLLFHGFLSRYSRWSTIGASAVLFGLMHMNPWQLASGVVLGLLLGWWFIRTRSLVPCLAAHAVVNSLTVLMPKLPFRIRGFNTDAPFATVTQFQPVWFDLLGVALLVAGCCWVSLLTREESLAPRPKDRGQLNADGGAESNGESNPRP